MNIDFKKNYLKKARDQYLAITFLLGGTRSKYSQLVADLQNSYILGQDHYPQDIEEAYNMILSYSPILGNVNTSDKTTKDLYTIGISFYQQTKTKTTKQSMTKSLLFQELVEEFLMTSNVTHAIKWDTMPLNAQTRQWLPRKMIATIKTKIKVLVSLSTNTT